MSALLQTGESNVDFELANPMFGGSVDGHQLFRTYTEHPEFCRACDIPVKGGRTPIASWKEVSTSTRIAAPTRPAMNTHRWSGVLRINLAAPRPSAGYAIANATGKRLRDLPLTRKRIKDAIDA